MIIRSLCVAIVVFMSTSALASSPECRFSTSFGASIYSSKPRVSYGWDSGTSLPANYLLSAGFQARILPSDLFVLVMLDRTWSGNREFFWNKTTVCSAAVGMPFVVGYAEIEAYVGVARYSETFSVETMVGGRSEVKDTRAGIMCGLNMVFPVFDRVDAITTYRVLKRNKGAPGRHIDLEPAYQIETNSLDHMISFGLGWSFGG